MKPVGQTSQGHAIKEPQAVNVAVTGAPGEPAALNQVNHETLHIPGGKPIRPLAVKTGRTGDRMQIARLFGLGQTAYDLVSDHLSA